MKPIKHACKRKIMALVIPQEPLPIAALLALFSPTGRPAASSGGSISASAISFFRNPPTGPEALAIRRLRCCGDGGRGLVEGGSGGGDVRGWGWGIGGKTLPAASVTWPSPVCSVSHLDQQVASI
jgi:hypothetical protein